ncbi:MAG: 4-hydroxythreonine-4-phosphate dehydrogenase PdxA [Spirochaetes bacterium]|nr:4-hydroxythreonine-4-phosphate dehydrogenase PdxA [Spirochaetota bacterium]
MSDTRPFIAISTGDPAGVGPEISVKALAKPKIYEISRPVLVGDRAVVEKAAGFCGSNLGINTVSSPQEGRYRAGTLDLIDLRNIRLDEYTEGEAAAVCGKAAYEYIERAAHLALDRDVDVLVTAPISKEAVKRAGVRYFGHTEILGNLCGVDDPLTMFETHGLRVFFLTRHMSLVDAIRSVTEERVYEYILRCSKALKKLGETDPILAVAGLNPHSGDGGLFGDEEIRCISPAVQRAKSSGVKVEGPLAADSVFALALRGKFSAVLSLYHDQGHIATKTLDFESTISVTLGLPFLRTSPDHGTAFDIAGTGNAHERSMESALSAAVRYSPLYRPSPFQ